MLPHAVSVWRQWIQSASQVFQARRVRTSGSSSAHAASSSAVHPSAISTATSSTSSSSLLGAYHSDLSFDDYVRLKDKDDLMPVVHELVSEFVSTNDKRRREIVTHLLAMKPLLIEQGVYRDRFIQWLDAHEGEAFKGPNIFTHTTIWPLGMAEIAPVLQSIYRFHKIYMLDAVARHFNIPVADDGKRRTLKYLGQLGASFHWVITAATPETVFERVQERQAQLAEARRWLGWIFDKKTVMEMGRNREVADFIIDQMIEQDTLPTSYCSCYVLSNFGDVIGSVTTLLQSMLTLGILTTNEQLLGLRAAFPLVRSSIDIPGSRADIKDAARWNFAFGGNVETLKWLVFHSGAHNPKMDHFVEFAVINSLQYGDTSVFTEERRVQGNVYPLPPAITSQYSLFYVFRHARPDTWDFIINRFPIGTQRDKAIHAMQTALKHLQKENE